MLSTYKTNTFIAPINLLNFTFNGFFTLSYNREGGGGETIHLFLPVKTIEKVNPGCSRTCNI